MSLSTSESFVTPMQTVSKTERFARRVLFAVLNRSQRGSFIVKENNREVAHFQGPLPGPHAEINVVNGKTYQAMVFSGDIGAGEAFMSGHWTSPDLTAVIEFFAANLNVLDALEKRLSWLTWPLHMLSHVRRRNSKARAKENIAAHYDLGNELYTRFLDTRLQYSSAVYTAADMSLEDAQEEKLRRLCDQLQLQPTDHLVEIGTGWGGLAIYAAERYGCKVTTTTISAEQYAYTENLVKQKGLEDRITLLKEDYRDLTGQFDKLVSVEMIEAVGAEYMSTFFKKCNALLKPGGLMVLQAITIADQRLERYNRNVDFIQKYIFPGGYLPSVELISSMYRKHTDMVVRSLDDIGLDYGMTLNAWRQRFNERRHELEPMGYDERFSRMWNYYLCYCEGGFKQRTISAIQLCASKSAHV